MIIFFLFFSVAVMLICVGYGVYGLQKGILVAKYTPETPGDVFRHEVATVLDKLQHLTDSMSPILAELLVRSGKYLYLHGAALYGNFTKRIFGRIDLDKGKAASFFVKQIREFKEELNREEKMME